MSINQEVITDLVCIDCGASLMRDLAECGELFDTARGNSGTTGSAPTGFDCPGRIYNGFMPHRLSIPVMCNDCGEFQDDCAALCQCDGCVEA